MSELDKEVRTRRIELGLTQRDLAKLSDTSLDTVQAIENGRRGNFKPTTVAKIQRALNERQAGIDASVAAAVHALEPEPFSFGLYYVTRSGQMHHLTDMRGTPVLDAVEDAILRGLLAYVLGEYEGKR